MTNEESRVGVGNWRKKEIEKGCWNEEMKIELGGGIKMGATKIVEMGLREDKINYVIGEG